MNFPSSAGLQIIGLRTLPEVLPGDPLGRLIADACEREGVVLVQGDLAVVTQKVVSKAEGRLVDLNEVTPSRLAMGFAERWEKDARLIEVVLRETRRIVRMDRGQLIVETRHGFVCANAGVDHSNVPGDEIVSLLPEDPDRSAQGILRELERRFRVSLGVIISDTFGRPWREGAVEVAIGVAGIEPLWDYRGATDAQGQLLRSTEIAIADEIAAAAGLVMEKASQVPAAIVRGFPLVPGESGIQRLVRPADRDLFR